MCMEDIRIGRETTSSITMVEVPGSPSTIQVARADPKRISLTIQAASNATVSVGPNSTIAINTGIGLTLPGHELHLNIRDHGSLVQREFWATASTTQTIAVLEAFLGKQ